MNFFSFLPIAYYSFFSSQLYRLVANAWRGYALRFLFLIGAVAMVSTIIRIELVINSIQVPQQYAGEDIDRSDYSYLINYVIDQMPILTIKGNSITAEVEQPYYIKDPRNGRVLVIIDTARADISDAKALLTIGNSSINVSLGQGDNYTAIKAAEITGNGKVTIVLTRDKLIDYVNQTLKNIAKMLVLLAPLMMLLFFAIDLVKAFICSYIILGLMQLWNLNLGYKARFRLAVVASAPPALVNIVLGWLWMNGSFALVHLLLYYGLIAGYLCFATHSSKGC